MSLNISTTSSSGYSASTKNYRFLFIDDSPTDNKYLSLLVKIKKLPIQPHFVYSAQKALNYLMKCQPNEFPEVLMVDINMPLMNGFEFVEKYLEYFGDTRPDSLIFITSSSIQLSDRERAEKHPRIRGFIDKPFNLRQFQDKILPVLDSIHGA